MLQNQARKILAAAVVAVLFCINPLTAQNNGWVLKYKYTGSGILEDLFVINPSTVVAVGDNGTILKTTDGGTTWSTKISGTSEFLNAVFFSTDSIGWIGGTNGKLLKTVNQGNTWTNITTGVTSDLEGIQFVDANIGYIVGANDLVLKTIDGGTTWAQSTVASTFNWLKDVHFLNKDTGWVCGTWGEIYNTINGGASWTNQSPVTVYDMPSIRFATPLIGFVACPVEGFFKTSDGGTNWVKDSTVSINDFYFYNSDTGWAGVRYDRSFLKTTNKGASWTSLFKENPFPEIIDLKFCDAMNGYAIAADKSIYRTTNGGNISEHDAGIDSVQPYPNNLCSGTHPVYARIKNYGLNTLTSVTVNWRVNGQVQTPFTWNGTLAPDSTSGYLNIGSAALTKGTNLIETWTSNLNGGTTDGRIVNDTAKLSVPNLKLNGSYTVGGSTPDFADFTTALNALSIYGICGPVTFKVRTGTYNETLSINKPADASSVNTITFESESGDSTSVILNSSTTTITFNSARYFTFRKMTIRSTGNGSVSVAANIKDSSAFITLENNVLEAQWTTNTGYNLSVVYLGSTVAAASDITLRNNLVRYGSHGFSLGGVSAVKPALNIRIENNTFLKQSYRGIYLSYLENPVINGNTVSYDSTYTSYDGIELINVNNGFEMKKNKISVKAGTGCYITYCNGSSGKEGWMTNNFIGGGNGTTYAGGIFMREVYYANLYHNSIYINSNNPSAVPFYFTYNDTMKYSNLNFVNNVLANNGSGYVYSAQNNQTNANPSYYNKLFGTFENNALYGKDKIFASLVNSGSLSDLKQWQIATGKDTASFMADPQFANYSDLHVYPQTSNYLLNGSALTLASVPDDIDGEVRSVTSPDIGADEFQAATLDAGVLSIQNNSRICAGNNSINVSIKNYGSAVLTAVTVNWQVNGVSQTPYSWNGTLNSGIESSVFAIGNYNFIQDSSYQLKIWTRNPNGGGDPVLQNDSLIATITAKGMSGVYTIGGASPTYTTLTAARNALVTNGVCGPVTFNIRPGTYSEQVSFPEISGASAINTITFKSENGDSSQVTISYAAVGVADNYVVLMDGADYFIFKNITFKATGGTSYTMVFNLRKGANNVTISNNRIEGLADNLIFSDTSFDNNIIIRNNFFYRGFTAVYLRGNYTPSGNIIKYEEGIEVRDNQFSRQAHAGIIIEYQSAPQVTGNNIPINEYSSSTSGTVGIKLMNSRGALRVMKNKIYGKCERGIWLYYCKSQSSERGVVANNFVSLDSAKAYYGISVEQSTEQSVSYNSVRMGNVSASTANAIYLYYSYYAVLSNNIFSNYSPGAAISAFGQPLLTSDHNNLFAVGPVLVSSFGSYADLDEWKNKTGYDANSVSADPSFVSVADLHINSNYTIDGKGVAVLGIGDDIDGDLRNGTSPDIGADEFTITPLPDDAGVIAIANPYPACSGVQTVNVTLKNFGSNALNNAVINWSVNGQPQTPFSWSGLLSPASASGAIAIGSYNFASPDSFVVKAWTSSPNGNTDPKPVNDSAKTGVIKPRLSGTYTIGGTTPDYPSFTAAANAMIIRGICGPVVFKARNNTYTESITIPEITGGSAVNTITFQSEAEDSMAVNLTINSGNPTIKFDGADNITVRKMTITQTSSGGAILITNKSNNVRITESKIAGVLNSSNGPNYSKVIEGNYIAGSTFFSAGSGAPDTGTVFKKNIVYTNSSTYALRFDNQQAARVESNYFNSSLTSTSYGIQFYSCNNNVTIIKNNITGKFNSGLFFNGSNGTSSSRILVANNVISNAAMGNGIELTTSSYINFYYNSIYMTKASSYGLSLASSSNLQLKNNHIINKGGGYAYFAGATNIIAASDYNNLYTNGANLVSRNSTNIANLSALQSATGMDANSISADPQFIAVDDLHPQNGAIAGKATPLTEVPDDIQGFTRDGIAPNIGAYEKPGTIIYDSLTKDIAVTRIATDTMVIGLNTISAVITNLKPFTPDTNYYKYKGTVDSLKLLYHINDSLIATENWTGNLAIGDSLIYSFTTKYNVPKGKVYRVRVTSILPANYAATGPANDTLTKVLNVKMSGAYTVGGVAPDFKDINEANAHLLQTGAASMVYFDLRPGIHRVCCFTIPKGPVTYRSESGNPEDVALDMSNVAANDVTFKNVTIYPRTNTDYQYNYKGLEIRDASNTTFDSCIIRGLPDSTYYKYGLTFTHTTAATVTNCRFVNLDHGVNFTDYKTAGNGSNFFYGINTISGNTFDTVKTCIRMMGRMNFDSTFVKKNIMNKPDYGIYIDSREGMYMHLFEGNRIDGAINNGIYITDNVSNGTNISSIHLINNMVSVSGTAQAVNIVSAGNIHLYNNSLYGALRIYGTPGCKLFSNSIYSFNTGTIALLIQKELSYANAYTSDNNNYYAPGSTTLVSVNSQNYSTVAALITGTQQDSNSVSVDPMYKSTTDLHSVSPLLNAAARPLPEVSTDIDGNPRDPNTPDIGADEFSPIADDAGILAFDTSITCGGTQPVVVSIKNFGYDTLKSAIINWEVNGTPQTPFSWSGAVSSLSSALVSIGTYPFVTGNSYTLKAWTNSPNGKTDGSFLNDTLTAVITANGMTGTYLIGSSGSANYNSVTAAVSALNSRGICGPVTFNIEAGTYTEGLRLKNVKGTSSVNTLTFQSQSGDSSSVIIQDTSSVVVLDNADFIYIKKITFKATDPLFSNIVVLKNGSGNNNFEGNVFDGQPSVFSSSSNADLVLSTGSISNNNNYFSGNLFSEGKYGARLQVLAGSEANVFVNNRMIDQVTRAFSFNSEKSPVIRDNYIYTTWHSVTSYTSMAVFLSACMDSLEISGNKIIDYNDGIYIYDCPGNPSSRSKIFNNFVSLDDGNAFSISNSSYLDIYFNSVWSRGTDDFLMVIGGTSGNINLLNNIFSRTGTGSARVLDMTNAAALTSCDYNDLYSAGTYLVGVNGTLYQTLADWQSASGKDLNSFSQLPPFVSASDLHIQTGNQLIKDGTPVGWISNDIDGDIRSISLPDVGADEYSKPLKNDASVDAVIKSTYCPGTYPVKAVISSIDVDTLTSLILNWSVNGAIQTPYSWSGNLLKGESDTVTIASQAFAAGNSYNILVWSSLPNNKADSVSTNDTAAATITTSGLGGTYLIGTGGSANYNTIQSAVDSILLYGLCGPVIFNIEPGTYVENIKINFIPGASASNTITFQSLANDSTSVTWKGNPSLELDNASFITFRKLTFTAPDSLYDRLVYLQNGSSDNTFLNNRFLGFAVTNSLSSMAVGFELSGSIPNNRNRIEKNYFKDGRGGAQIGTTVLSSGNTILNNIFEGQVSSITQLYNQEDPVINDNIMTAGGNETNNGIYLILCRGAIQIERNKIYKPLSGILMFSCSSPYSTPARIINNFVSTSGNPSGGAGIMISGDTAVSVYYNSVYCSDSADIPMYASGNNSEISIVNNIFVKAGAGFNPCAAITDTAFLKKCDYNSYYSPSLPLIGSMGNTYDSLSQWQSGMGRDLNSFFLNAPFVSAADLHLASASVLNQGGTPVTGIFYDIDGDYRDPVKPDIGADQTTPSVLLVWPGDANSDFTANNYDLLPVGVHYGSAGAARDSISNLWVGNKATDWGTKQVNGYDLKFADCNGDGLINNNDTLAINLNYSSIHSKKQISYTYNNADPDLYLKASKDSFLAGEWVDIEIGAGTALIPVQNLYGLGFNILINGVPVDPGSMSMEYPAGWLGTPGTDAIKIGKTFDASGEAHGAMVRTDHKNVTGFGKISMLRFRIPASYSTPSSISIRISSFKAIDSAGKEIKLNTDTLKLVLNGGVSIPDIHGNKVHFSMFPNPAKEILYLNYTLSESAEVSVELYDILGHRTAILENRKQQKGEYRSSLVLSQFNIPEGIYLVKFSIGENIITGRLSVIK